MDTDGNVYVSGANSRNAFRIAPGGAVTEIMDETGDGTVGVAGAGSVAVDAAGNVYVADGHPFGGPVFRIAPGGTISRIIDSNGDGSGHGLSGPTSLGIDDAGNVHVVGGFSDNVFRVTPGGAITQLLGAKGDGRGNHFGPVPFGLDVDAVGNIYVGGGASGTAFQITPGGRITPLIDANAEEVGDHLPRAGDVAVGGDGSVYVGGAASVFKVDPAPHGHPIVGARLTVKDLTRPGPPPVTIRKLTFLARLQPVFHHTAGAQTACGEFGSPACTATVATLEVIDAGNPANRGVFEIREGGLPAGGREGWKTDGAIVARFVNRDAPTGGGTTGIRTFLSARGTRDRDTNLTPGKQLKAAAASLGDSAQLALPISGDGTVDVLFRTGIHTFCARFGTSGTIVQTPLFASGVPIGNEYVATDPIGPGTCPPPSTTTSSTTTTTVP